MIWPKRNEKGFSLLEVLVVMGIIVIVAAILYPVFARAKVKAETATCLSNLCSLAQVAKTYANDYDGFLPPKENPDPIRTVGRDNAIALYCCPTFTWKQSLRSRLTGYGINNCLTGIRSLAKPEGIVLFADAGKPRITTTEGFAYRHFYDPLMASVAFVDGHVKVYSRREGKELRLQAPVQGKSVILAPKGTVIIPAPGSRIILPDKREIVTQ